MTGIANLGISAVVASQTQKEVTVNAAIERLASALTETFAADVSAGNVTLTAAEYQAAIQVRADGAATSGRTVTLPAHEKIVILANVATATDPVGFVVGSTTVSVAPGVAILARTDGTTNGLATIMAGSPTGSVGVEDEGTPLATARALNFIGGGVVASDGGGGVVDVTIAGGGSGVDVQDETTPVMTAATMNFTGAGVTVTDAGGGVAQVSIAGGAGDWTVVKKTADQSKTTDTTLADDSQLTVALTSGQTYTIRGFVFFSGTDNSDVRWKLNYSSTTSFVAEWVGGSNDMAANDISSSTNLFSGTHQALFTSPVPWNIFANPRTMSFQFHVIITPSGSGTFSLQWAQGTSSADATTVRKGSYMEVMQI